MGVKELVALDANDLTDEELADAAVELDRLRNAFAAGEAQLLRTFKVRGVYAADGAKSAAAWLATRTHAPKAECGSRLRLGKTMEDLPVAAEALAAGEIGPAQLRCLAGARQEQRSRECATKPKFEPGLIVNQHDVLGRQGKLVEEDGVTRLAGDVQTSMHARTPGIDTDQRGPLRPLD